MLAVSGIAQLGLFWLVAVKKLSDGIASFAFRHNHFRDIRQQQRITRRRPRIEMQGVGSVSSGASRVPQSAVDIPTPQEDLSSAREILWSLTVACSTDREVSGSCKRVCSRYTEFSGIDFYDQPWPDGSGEIWQPQIRSRKQPATRADRGKAEAPREQGPRPSSRGSAAVGGSADAAYSQR